jgi:hypothetical protein
MSDMEELRRVVLALPDTTEGTHFRMPAFKVAGQNFIGVQKDGSVTLALGSAEAADIAAADPAITEIRRNDKVIGIQLDLAAIPPERLADLVKLSWRAKSS